VPRTKVPERLLRKGFSPGWIETPEGVTVEFHDDGFFSFHRVAEPNRKVEFLVVAWEPRDRLHVVDAPPPEGDGT